MHIALLKKRHYKNGGSKAAAKAAGKAAAKNNKSIRKDFFEDFSLEESILTIRQNYKIHFLCLFNI